MHRACRRLREHRGVGLEAIDGEDLTVIGADVLGEESGPVNPHTLCVGAATKLSGQAIVAVSAVDIRVDRHPLPGAETRDLTSDHIDLANRLVPGCKRIDADVGPMVQVHIRAAHSRLVDPDSHVEGPNRRHRHVRDREVARYFVTHGSHDLAILITKSARGLLRAMRTALSWSVVRAQTSACSGLIPCN